MAVVVWTDLERPLIIRTLVAVQPPGASTGAPPPTTGQLWPRGNLS